MPTNPRVWDEKHLRGEVKRVFEICNGCRLCFNVCPSFDVLFKRIDALDPHREEAEGKHLEGGMLEEHEAKKLLDQVEVHTESPVSLLSDEDKYRVVELCYECKLCFPKCPYVPPHEFAVDFPRLMLRAKMARAREDGIAFRERFLGATDLPGAGLLRNAELDGGDLEGARRLARRNVEALLPAVREGRKILSPGPSCTLVLRTEYPELVGTPEAREVSKPVMDGTWGMKTEFFAQSLQVADAAANRIDAAEPDVVSSDCPLAAGVRDQFRREVIAAKQARRVTVGPSVTFVFENRLTVKFQVQEILRAERIVAEEQVRKELEGFNTMLPDKGDLSATLLIELFVIDHPAYVHRQELSDAVRAELARDLVSEGS